LTKDPHPDGKSKQNPSSTGESGELGEKKTRFIINEDAGFEDQNSLGTDFSSDLDHRSKQDSSFEEFGDFHDDQTRFIINDGADFKYQNELSPTFLMDPESRYPLINPDSMDVVEEPDAALIGRGGFGHVFAAFDRNIGRAVAVKELISRKQSIALNRFLFEARLTGQLDHPNIVPVYEIGVRKDGSYYYTMKMIKGRTLADAIDQSHSLSARLGFLHNFIALCHAIGYAHSRDILHLDIKSSNVMLGDYGETVVLDWGLAKVLDPSVEGSNQGESSFEWLKSNKPGNQKNFMEGVIAGTIYYMSPEQASGQFNQLDAGSDVWSLGAVLYEVLTGEPPFIDRSTMGAIKAVQTEPVPPVHQTNPEAPAELVAIAEKALSHDKLDRYANANEMVRELEAYRAGHRVRAYEYSSLELLIKFTKKNKAITLITSAAVIFLVIATVLIFNAYQKAEIAREQEHFERLRAQENELLANHNLSVADYEKARGFLYKRNYLLASLYSASALSNNPANPVGRFRYVANQGFSDPTSAEQLILQRTIYFQSMAENFITFFHRFETDQDFIRDVKFTSGSEKLVVAHGEGGEVSIHSFSDKEKAVIQKHENRVLEVAVSSNGRWIASGGRGDTIKVLDQHNRKHVKDIPFSQGEIYDLAFSPNDKYLAAAGKGLGVLLFSVSDWKLVGRIKPTSDFVASLDFSPDSSRLVSGGSQDLIEIWSVPSLGPIDKWEGHDGDIESVRFSPDGSLIVSASDDKTAMVWDPSSGEILTTIRGHDDWVWNALFTPAGDKLITSSRDNSIKIWSLPGYDCVSTIKLSHDDGNPSSIAISPNGRYLASAGYGSAITLWKIEQQATAKRFRGNKTVVVSAEISPDGSTLVSTTWNKAHLWSTEDQRMIGEIKAPRCLIRSASFSSDGKYMAMGGDDSVGRVYRYPEFDVAAQLKGHTGKIMSVAFSPRSDIVATAGSDKTIRLWNVGTFHPLAVLKGHRKCVRCIAFSPDGMTLASGGKDGALKLWDISDPNEFREIRTFAQEDWVTRVAFFPDGKKILTAGKDGRLRCWDIQSGKLLHILLAHSKWINDMDISPDGRLVITGSDDGALCLWRADTWEMLLRLGFQTEVTFASFTPDGAEFAFNDGLNMVFYPTDLSMLEKDPVLLLSWAEKASNVKSRPYGRHR